MICSPARRAANINNSAKSSGPRTIQGKEKSRANGLKHGLTGAGVVLTSGDEAEVAALTAELETEMKPAEAMGRILLRRVAVLSVRLDRCARFDAATTDQRVREAAGVRDETRRGQAKALDKKLIHHPADIFPKLQATSEGIDELIHSWEFMLDDLKRPGGLGWNHIDRSKVNSLLGGIRDDRELKAFDALGRAAKGECSALSDEQGAHLAPAERQAWAHAQISAMIHAKIDDLRELRQVREEEEAEERAQAADRALFDPSLPAERARKYESAAERGLFRTLREFRQVEAEARAEEAPAETVAMGSSLPEAEPEPRERITGPNGSPPRMGSSSARISATPQTRLERVTMSENQTSSGG